MAQGAGMLASLFERSMGLDDTWEVTEVWFEEVDGGVDELRVRAARVRGKAARGFRNVDYFTTAIFLSLGGPSFDALACAGS